MPPLTIITGFLGSGKTTLLRRVIERGAGGRRVGLVVNEIGAVGFDGRALEQAGGPPLVELTGGCICCAAGSDFLLAIEQLIDYADPDLIVVETTGLAEPGGMIRQARAAGLPLDAVVAVAGAPDLAAALAASPVAGWQLRAADIIVLSKIDLADAPAQAAATERLRALNPRAAIIPAANGEVSPDLLFGPAFVVRQPATGNRQPAGQRGLSASSDPAHPGASAGAPGDSDPPPAPDHLALDGFGSFVWAGDAPLRRASLEAALKELPAAVYRAKGIVHCTDAPWADEVQYVAGRLDLRATRLPDLPAPLNQLVLIGADLGPQQAAIRARLDACADSAERRERWYAGREEG